VASCGNDAIINRIRNPSIFDGSELFYSTLPFHQKLLATYHGEDDMEILKMSKNRILQFFKRIIEQNDRTMDDKEQFFERIIADKEKIIKAQNEILRFMDDKLSSSNAKYLKIKGNLNIRGLVEEFEQMDIFKMCRKRMTTKVTVTDKTTNKSSVESRFPSRQDLWNKVLKEAQFASLLTCIEELSSERRDSVGDRVKDLYNSTVSKSVHKPGDFDSIVIMKNALMDHEAKLAICLCKFYPVDYEVVEEFGPKLREDEEDSP